MILLKTELYKIWQSHIPVLAIVLLIIVSGLFYGIQAQTDQDYYQQQYQIIKQESYQIEIELQLAYLDQSTLDRRQTAFLTEYSQQLALYYIQNEETEILPILINLDQLRLQGLEAGIDIFGKSSDTINIDLARNEILLAKHQNPVIIDNNLAFYPLIRAFHLQSWSFILLLATVIISVFVFLENEHSATLKSTYSYPYQRSRIYLAKYFAAFLTSLGIYILWLGIGWLWLYPHSGVTLANYPILFDSGYHCIAILSTIVKQVILADLIMILAVTALTGFLTVLTFNHSLSLIIALIGGGFISGWLFEVSLNTVIRHNALFYLPVIISGILISLSFLLISRKDIGF
ncbi:MAG: hypothetical protein VB012_03290 [Erysipelotrichaceae bacterium]|nr:hypothetical protein [Erysipelotrichaceae bacterium]